MAELVTLTEDGPLGKAGDRVWVDDAAQAQAPDGWVDPNAKPSRKTQAAATSPAPAEEPAGDQPAS